MWRCARVFHRFSCQPDILLPPTMRSAVLILALASGVSALRQTAKLDINQIVYIEGNAVLGDGTGQGALNQCRNLADFFIDSPKKPSVKVCGTGIKLTVYLMGRCGEGAVQSAGLAHKFEVGACDTSLEASTCKAMSPADDARMGATQSYKITTC